MRGRNIKRGLRKALHTVRRGAGLVRRVATTAKTIIGKVDKMSGGMLTKTLQTDPRGQALLTGVHAVAK